MITISHTYLFIQRKWTFVGSCVPFWSIFARNNSSPIDSFKRNHLGWDIFTELFLSNIMKYGENDIEWQTSIQGIWVICGILWEKEALTMVLWYHQTTVNCSALVPSRTLDRCWFFFFRMSRWKCLLQDNVWSFSPLLVV